MANRGLSEKGAAVPAGEKQALQGRTRYASSSHEDTGATEDAAGCRFAAGRNAGALFGQALSAVAVRRPRETAIALARAVPVWAWLVTLVAVSTAVRCVLSRGMVAPWIMVDELVYSELAKSFAEHGRFLVRDEATAAYGFVYPLLLAPAWALFEAVPQAYAAAKAINALVMSAAALPAYFLARRVLPPWWALAAAVLTVSVPSMTYTGTLMTENAFYPVFLCVALATCLWLERPTWQRTALVLGVSLVAYLTRAQAVAVFPALLTAPLLLRGRRAVRDYRLLYGVTGGAVLLVLVVQAARGASPFGLFGAYTAATERHYHLWRVLRWFLYHVAELDLALGVIPFAALLLLALMLRDLPERARIFLAASVALAFWLVLLVAAFASVETLRVEERNMFYVAPFFLIALLVWLERGAPRPAPPAAAAVIVAAALPGVLPYSTLINLNAVSDTPAILAVWGLHPDPFSLEDLPGVIVLASLVAGLLVLFLPRRWALVLPALVLMYFAVSQKPIDGKHRFASLGALYAGIGGAPRDWVDRAVGRDADVVALWSGNAERYTIWENEFFSRSVGRIYDVGPRFSGGLAETPVTVDERSGVVRAGGQPVRARNVLTDGSLEIEGRIVARDRSKGMLLYRAREPLRQVSRVAGLYPQDTWSGREARYTRLGCRGGAVTVLLQSDPSLFTRPQLVTAYVEGRQAAFRRVAPGAARELRVPLQPRGGRCVVRYRVTPTAVPAVVTKGVNPDRRELGIHFSRFSYSPPAG